MVSSIDEVSLAALATKPSGPINSEYGPWTQSLDLKATRAFSVSGLNLSAYLWVINAFDSDNAVSVFNGTGSALTTGFLDTAPGQDVVDKLAAEGIDGRDAYAKAVQNQSLFGNPRVVRFGVRMGF